MQCRLLVLHLLVLFLEEESLWVLQDHEPLLKVGRRGGLPRATLIGQRREDIDLVGGVLGVEWFLGVHFLQVI